MDHAAGECLVDKEVILTFGDGPVPCYTNPMLDILAAQCAKATFFLVGEMAHTHPAAARRIYAEGRTIGKHSEDHPLRFGKLPIEKIRWEIGEGTIEVGAALGDPREFAPFFRIRGWPDRTVVEKELAARSLVVFGSDTVADDWHHRITLSKIIELAMKRLEARGKGILLLHHIHPRDGGCSTGPPEGVKGEELPGCAGRACCTGAILRRSAEQSPFLLAVGDRLKYSCSGRYHSD